MGIGIQYLSRLSTKASEIFVKTMAVGHYHHHVNRIIRYLLLVATLATSLGHISYVFSIVAEQEHVSKNMDVSREAPYVTTEPTCYDFTKMLRDLRRGWFQNICYCKSCLSCNNAVCHVVLKTTPHETTPYASPKCSQEKPKPAVLTFQMKL